MRGLRLVETGSALTSVVFSRLSLCSTSKGTALSQWNGLFFQRYRSFANLQRHVGSFPSASFRPPAEVREMCGYVVKGGGLRQ